MTTGTTDAIEQAQQLLADAMARTPFRKYAKEFLWIEDEKGRILPFILNEAQLIVDREVERQVMLGRPVRILILKGRQKRSRACRRTARGARRTGLSLDARAA